MHLQTHPYLSADVLHCKSLEFYVIRGNFLFVEGSRALSDIYVILGGMNQQKKANQRESSSLFCVIIMPGRTTAWEGGLKSLKLLHF